MDNNYSNEFDRQADNLLKKSYPKALNLSEKDFLNKINLLKIKLDVLEPFNIDYETGVLPFVIVVNSNEMTAETMMEKTEKDGVRGVTILRPLTSLSFKTIESVSISNEMAYLLVNIDRGKKYLNVRPEDALKKITAEGRSPLTISEGIAIITHFPEFLSKNNCFSLLASRTGSDQRVPAIWINAKKQPNLGWCWDRNPHTWLGSASCTKRYPL